MKWQKKEVNDEWKKHKMTEECSVIAGEGKRKRVKSGGRGRPVSSVLSHPKEPPGSRGSTETHHDLFFDFMP